MLSTEPGLQRLRMSWEEYLLLPEKPKAEWVDGEVVVSPPVGEPHGIATANVIFTIKTALSQLRVMTEVGVWLPRNRLRAPDVMVTTAPTTTMWVEDAPVLVVEVLSPSTRSEDTMRKGPEYLAAGIGQYWVVDPDARAIDVFENVDGVWELLLRLDAGRLAGEVVVGDHGTVPLVLDEILPPL